jgi:DNA-binding winged helix-turn-helix (wHTH) protein
VRDVIKTILERDGPLTREDIIRQVLKERFVKENTIAVNLHNSRFFKRDPEGKYKSI